jgi:adenosylhomocysteine nucleosidase
MMLLFFAMPEEARPFLRAWERTTGARFAKTETLGVARAPCFRIARLRVQVTGMGPRNARRVAEAALAAETCEFVVTAGLAGGLDPALRTGDLVFDADADFPRMEALRRTTAREGRFLTVERVVATAAAKAALRRETGADAVDMESAAIRQVCRARGIPSATLRVISDGADEDLPIDLGDLLTADDRVDFARVAFSLLRSPTKIPALVRLYESMGRAGERLAGALVDVLSTSRADQIISREPT